jgi:hypothetical protein
VTRRDCPNGDFIRSWWYGLDFLRADAIIDAQAEIPDRRTAKD